jgi:hypothetical protein
MSARSRMLPAALLAALLVASACAQSRPSPARGLQADGDVPVDPQVMAYLSLARARHHEANLDEDSDVPGAIAALEKLTSAERPHRGALVPEIEEVLADTYAREAELYVRLGNTAKAQAAVREGLTHATEPSYFRGHLLEVGGIVEETRAAALRDAGQPGEAAAAKARALDLLHQAVLVQERVIHDSLGEPATGSGGGR